MTIILHSLCGTDTKRPFSPHCWKAVMALSHKGLDFVERPVPFTGIPALENGFSRTVPILNDNGHLVSDSFAIALYLEDTYPDRPSLFKGEGGKAMARFVEGYTQTVLQAALMPIIVMSIHDILPEKDKAYFRESREARLGRPLEEVVATRAEAEKAAFPGKLEPLRHMLKFQPYLGGDSPLFADYILFGALQWARVTSGSLPLSADDPAMEWFGRCLDLFEGRGRHVTAA